MLYYRMLISLNIYYFGGSVFLMMKNNDGVHMNAPK